VDPQRLAALERELLSCDTGEGADLQAISESGHKLHRLILESCENRLLANMIDSLHDHFRRFRSLSLQIPEKALLSHNEHLEIIEALKDRDGDRAERLVHLHFDHALSYLLDGLLRHPSHNMRVRWWPE